MQWLSLIKKVSKQSETVLNNPDLHESQGKVIQSKMEELGITNVKVGEDEEGKIKIDTTGAGSAGKDEL